MLTIAHRLQMDTALYHKFTQHRDLKRELLATGDAELIEVRFHDRFPSCRLTNETVSRTRTRIGSGDVGRMGREGTSSGERLDGFVNISANRRSGEIARVLSGFLYAGFGGCVTL